MYRMTDEEFEVAVAEALDAMPEQFMEALPNVAVVWEEEPSAYHLGHDEEWGAEMRDAEGEDEFDDLLGLFDGLSIVERASSDDAAIITVSKRDSVALTAARKSWKRSARPSSMSWVTICAKMPWGTVSKTIAPSKKHGGDENPYLLNDRHRSCEVS